MGDGGADLKEPEVAAGAEMLVLELVLDHFGTPEHNETWFDEAYRSLRYIDTDHLSNPLNRVQIAVIRC